MDAFFSRSHLIFNELISLYFHLYYDIGNYVISEETGKVRKIQKHLLCVSIRELHQHCISKNGDRYKNAYDENGKVRITEYMLRRVRPNWLVKFSKRYKQICGCENCIVANGLQQSLNYWCVSKLFQEKEKLEKMHEGRTKVEQRVRVAVYERETMKEKDGKKEHIHQNAWTACDCVACPKVKIMNGQEHHHFKCSLRFCQECPSLKVPVMEKDYDELISYHVYEGVKLCNQKTHKRSFLEVGDDSKLYCRLCRDMTDKEKDKLKKQPAITSKKFRILKTEQIKDFMAPDGTYQKNLADYVFHKSHVVLLGKDGCGKSRTAEAEADPYIMQMQRDFAERYTPRPDGEIMSEGFAIDQSLGMEGVFVNYHPLGSDQRKKMMVCHLTDEQRQDGDVVRTNLKAMLKDMQEKGAI